MTYEEATKWLEDNELILNGNQKISNENMDMLFKVYRFLTNDNVSKTTCGRCIYNMIKRLKIKWDKIKTEYYEGFIYRSNLGHLTLKKQPNIAYKIMIKTEQDLVEALERYKKLEKTN